MPAKAAMAIGDIARTHFILKKEPAWLMRMGALFPAGAVSAGDVLIDGNAIGDVGNVVLRDP